MSISMKKMKHSRFIVWVLLFILIISFVIIYSNLHFHILNGLVIVHGHPYNNAENNNSPLTSHSHSSFDYLYYSFINIFEFFIFLIVSIIFLVKLLNYIKNSFKHLTYNNPFVVIPCFRAPPAS